MKINETILTEILQAASGIYIPDEESTQLYRQHLHNATREHIKKDLA